MTEDTTLIARELSAAPIGKITSITHVGTGYTSDAYKVITSEGEFIALTPKSDTMEVPDYAYQFAVLKTLEAINYQFAPRAVYLNPEHSVMLMSAAPGEAFTWINTASESQQKQAVEILITALLDLREASFPLCAQTYKQLSGKELEPVTINKNVKRYMSDWFKLAQSGQPDPALTKWIEPKVVACETFASHTKPGKLIVLDHGDTSEGNILLTPDLQLHLIDWDASFNHFPERWDDFGIAYLMNHVPIFQKYRAFAISFLSERCRISVAELEAVISRVQELIKLGDINWAYMMHARAVTGEIKSQPPQFFMDTAKERINDYETMFADHSFLS